MLYQVHAEKLEARKMPVNRADSRRPLHAVLGGGNIANILLPIWKLIGFAV